jgi:putative oxidoreductase
MSHFFCFLGRILFSSIFILKSVEHFSSDTAQYADQAGVPLASLFVPIAGVIALLGGLSILFGYKAKVGAWLLIIFLVPTTFAMHPFWQSEGNFEVMMQQYCFLKNISMTGAALMISHFGSGPWSLKH